MNKKIKIISISLFSLMVFGFLFFGINNVLAAKIGDYGTPLNQVVKISGITGSAIPQNDLASAVGFWIRVALGLIGTVFFILIVYSAFNWMVSQGEEEKIKKSQKTIVASVIGLLIIVSAYAITSLVSKNLIEKNVGQNVPNVVYGCCSDWVKTDIVQVGIAACRITTYDDCKKVGESPTPTDVHAGKEGEGNWTWDPKITDQNTCQAMCAK